MKKNLILLVGAICSTLCTAALVQSCEDSKRQVYDVKSVVNGKVITVIEGNTVRPIEIGDSVIVNVGDSEIEDHLQEIRDSYYNQANVKIDTASLFVVQSSYKIND